MTRRSNHYEAAFEEYLRQRRIPYVAIDESRRSLCGQGSLKSLDFLVSPAEGDSWLVDVKGRRFVSGPRGSYWKNWSTRDDLVSLARWQQRFGQGFRGLLVFAYYVVGDLSPLPVDQLCEHRGGLYAFVGIRLEHYASWCRPRSARWQTVSMPTARFRSLAYPLDRLFAPSAAASGPPEAEATATLAPNLSAAAF